MLKLLIFNDILVHIYQHHAVSLPYTYFPYFLYIVLIPYLYLFSCLATNLIIHTCRVSHYHPQSPCLGIVFSVDVPTLRLSRYHPPSPHLGILLSIIAPPSKVSHYQLPYHYLDLIPKMNVKPTKELSYHPPYPKLGRELFLWMQITQECHVAILHQQTWWWYFPRMYVPLQYRHYLLGMKQGDLAWVQISETEHRATVLHSRPNHDGNVLVK